MDEKWENHGNVKEVFYSKLGKGSGSQSWQCIRKIEVVKRKKKQISAPYARRLKQNLGKRDLEFCVFVKPQGVDLQLNHDLLWELLNEIALEHGLCCCSRNTANYRGGKKLISVSYNSLEVNSPGWWPCLFKSRAPSICCSSSPPVLSLSVQLKLATATSTS